MNVELNDLQSTVEFVAFWSFFFGVVVGYPINLMARDFVYPVSRRVYRLLRRRYRKLNTA